MNYFSKDTVLRLDIYMRHSRHSYLYMTAIAIHEDVYIGYSLHLMKSV